MPSKSSGTKRTTINLVRNRASTGHSASKSSSSRGMGTLPTKSDKDKDKDKAKDKFKVTLPDRTMLTGRDIASGTMLKGKDIVPGTLLAGRDTATATRPFRSNTAPASTTLPGLNMGSILTSNLDLKMATKQLQHNTLKSDEDLARGMGAFTITTAILEDNDLEDSELVYLPRDSRQAMFDKLKMQRLEPKFPPTEYFSEPSKVSWMAKLTDNRKCKTKEPPPRYAGGGSPLSDDVDWSDSFGRMKSKSKKPSRSQRPSRVDTLGQNPSQTLATGSLLQSDLDRKMASRQTRYASLAPEEQQEQENWAQHMIQLVGICPAGFAWKRVPTGYRCWGGHHAMTDADIAEGLGGYRLTHRIFDDNDLLFWPPKGTWDFPGGKLYPRHIGLELQRGLGTVSSRCEGYFDVQLRKRGTDLERETFAWHEQQKVNHLNQLFAVQGVGWSPQISATLSSKSGGRHYRTF